MEHILENPLFIDEISISGIIGIKGYDDSGTDTSYAAKAVKSKNAKSHAVTQLSHTFLDKVSIAGLNTTIPLFTLAHFL
jgi:hypothetical protein